MCSSTIIGRHIHRSDKQRSMDTPIVGSVRQPGRRQADRQAGIRTVSKTVVRANRQTDRQANRQTGEQTAKHPGRQTGRHANRHVHRKTNKRHMNISTQTMHHALSTHIHSMTRPEVLMQRVCRASQTLHSYSTCLPTCDLNTLF